MLVGGLLLALGCDEPSQPVVVSGDDGGTHEATADAGASSDTGDASSHIADSGRSDAGTVRAACRIEQYDWAPGVYGAGATLNGEDIYVASQYGVYRLATGSHTPELVSFSPVQDEVIQDVAAVGDALYLHTVPNTYESSLWKSVDRGATWIPVEVERPFNRIASNGHLLLLENTLDGGGFSILDENTSAWSFIHLEPPVDDPETSHLAVMFLAFDGDDIIANDVYGGGVLKAVRGATHWQRLPGLTAWGYSDFKNSLGLSLTSSTSGVFVRGIEDSSSFVQTLNTDVSKLVPLSAEVLAFGPEGVHRSSDGRTWSLDATRTFSQYANVLAAGERVVTWRDGVLGISDDGAQTWGDAQIRASAVQTILATENQLFSSVKSGAEGVANYWYAEHGPEYTNWGVLSRSGDDLWACDIEYCELRSASDGSTVRRFQIRSEIGSFLRAYATSYGLFVWDSDYYNDGCEGREGEYFARLSKDGAWTSAESGLPLEHDADGCPVQPRVSNVFEFEGDLFAVLVKNRFYNEERWDDPEDDALGLYRSRDGGLTWEEAGDRFVYGAANFAHDMFIATPGGVFRGGHDSSWSHVDLPIAGLVTDVVATESALFVSVRGDDYSGTLLRSLDGVHWTQIELGIRGWVPDLDLLDDTLYIGTAAEGLWTLDARCE